MSRDLNKFIALYDSWQNAKECQHIISCEATELAAGTHDNSKADIMIIIVKIQSSDEGPTIKSSAVVVKLH